METIGDRIRRARTQKGFTQQQLADHFGIARVSVTQWENNTTQPGSDKLIGLTELLGGDAEWYITGHGMPPISDGVRIAVKQSGHPKREMTDAPNATIGEKVTGAGVMVPVYGQAVGGIDGQFLMNGTILYEVMAPPQIAEIAGAYGVQISGDSMFPRYEDGEVAFVDPRRRVKKGDYVVAQIQFDEHEPPHAYVKRFVRHNAEELVLSQFNPPKELTFDHDQVVSVHFIALAGVA
ncbi:helix-turn-helix domain-containing protein [Brucella anthropi]|uniref:Phage repressor n=2 Tax=Brucella anthropi TaxID=529 RepID=A6WVE6_BRUA4|nr:helix-turn-helix domain-containing protein [Brucella anthropi]ABS12950.1 putative phage repressor [Brucella anthropi ATCC 49188]QQC24797.1 helix-turn-helix domain-containing protein [Brucella anthropi]